MFMLMGLELRRHIDNSREEAAKMTSDQENMAHRRGVSLRQVATVLQDSGYRGLVDEEGTCVHSAAMGLDFRVVLHGLIEGDANEDRYESYLFDMGLYCTVPVPLSAILLRCNELNHRFRYAKFFGGQNDAGRCYAAVQMDVLADATGDLTLQRSCGMFTSMAVVLRDLIHAVESEINHDAISEHSRAVQLMQGTVDDQVRACELYWHSANKGFAGALNNLGDLYEHGVNLPQSQTVAAYWYGRAAERGEPTAYLSLATLLLEVAEDNWMYIEAAKFALLAVENLVEGTNKSLAKEALERLEALLPEDAMGFAKAMARRWEPLFQEPNLMSDKPSPDAQTVRLLN
jgi:hypothetical protein